MMTAAILLAFNVSLVLQVKWQLSCTVHSSQTIPSNSCKLSNFPGTKRYIGFPSDINSSDVMAIGLQTQLLTPVCRSNIIFSVDHSTKGVRRECKKDQAKGAKLYARLAWLICTRSVPTSYVHFKKYSPLPSVYTLFSSSSYSVEQRLLTLAVFKTCSVWVSSQNLNCNGSGYGVGLSAFQTPIPLLR